MNDTFKVGDVVCLNSGSPKMTITYIHKNTNKITCEWFYPNTGIQTAEFPPMALSLPTISKYYRFDGNE